LFQQYDTDNSGTIDIKVSPSPSPSIALHGF